MTRILVTGATGFVGRALCPVFVAAGHEVLASSRNPEAAKDMDGVEPVLAPELGPDAEWRPALAGVEVVAHLASRVHVTEERSADPLAAYRRVNSEGTRRLAEEAAQAGVRRLVFLSTVKVNGESSGEMPFREDDTPAPRDAYGQTKWEAEEALFEVAERSGMEAVVLRPPLVYGGGVKGNFLSLLKLCMRAPPLPLGGIDNRRSMIHAGNLADAVTLCLASPGAAGQTFLVRDGDDVSTTELVRHLAAALGRPARLFWAPPGLLRLAGAAIGKSAAIGRLLDTLSVDDRKIRGELGWTPPLTMVKGLAETAAWFKARAGQ